MCVSICDIVVTRPAGWSACGLSRQAVYLFCAISVFVSCISTVCLCDSCYRENGMEKKISFVFGRVEDVLLPFEKVSIVLLLASERRRFVVF